MIVSLLFVSLNSNSLYRWIEMVLIISNIFLGKIILLKLNLSQARDLSARASDHLRHKKLNTTPEFNNMLNSRKRMVTSKCKYFFIFLSIASFRIESK